MSQGYLQFPNIDPVLVSIGPVSIRWYGLMYLVGFMFALWLANRRADKPGSGWTREQVSDSLFAGFLGSSSVVASVTLSSITLNCFR